MLKYIVASVLVAFMSAATAEVNTLQKPVPCEQLEKVLENIAKSDYKEKAIWSGFSQSEESIFTIFVNKETKTWTLLQISGGYACVLGFGNGLSNDPMNK